MPLMRIHVSVTVILSLSSQVYVSLGNPVNLLNVCVVQDIRALHHLFMVAVNAVQEATSHMLQMDNALLAPQDHLFLVASPMPLILHYVVAESMLSSMTLVIVANAKQGMVAMPQ